MWVSAALCSAVAVLLSLGRVQGIDYSTAFDCKVFCPLKRGMNNCVLQWISDTSMAYSVTYFQKSRDICCDQEYLMGMGKEIRFFGSKVQSKHPLVHHHPE